MKSIQFKLAAIALVSVWALSSCKEQIEEGARFTFKGKTIATYLADDEQQQFTSFLEILSRGECLGLMKAYGQYTCFAPTNTAVQTFLNQQHELWIAWKDSCDKNPDAKIEEVGLRSNQLSALSDDMCRTIARNHILPKMYLGVDLIGNQIPEANMNDRNLTLAFKTDTLTGKSVAMINSEARVLDEEEVENGVVHVIENVLNPSTLSFMTQIGEYEYFSIFNDALDKTGYAHKKNIGAREDLTYTEGDKIVKSIRSTEDANYPANRYFGYTAFLVPDAVLKEKYGISSFEGRGGLVEKCREWYPAGTQAWEYDEVNDEWKSIEISHDESIPYTDARHPVNQFVGYHLLDRKVAYENLVCYNIEATGNGGSFDSEGDFPNLEDRTEYYVTMNNRILKATMPRSDKAYPLGTILLNYAKDCVGEEKMNIGVYAPNDFKADDKYKKFVQEALNGSLNVVKDVLLYDDVVMSGKVLYCVMRFDVSALLSELTNSNIRWKYGTMLNSDGAVFIPHTYCKNVDVRTDDTRLFYLAPHTVWHNYQGDEMMALGFFDFAYRLPPVPTGTYEIRMGYSASQWRHMVQVYLDDEVTGLPIDLRIDGSDPKIGWVEEDPETTTEEERAANEKEMKNRGYMRGPTSFYDNADNLAWYSPTCLRAVIATKYLSADKPHWLRFKNVLDTDDGSSQFMHDYFEIVPTNYLRDENVTVEDRRK